MILLGSAITSFTDGGGDMFADRLGELGVAAIYAVVMLYILEAFFPKHFSDTDDQLTGVNSQ